MSDTHTTVGSDDDTTGSNTPPRSRERRRRELIEAAMRAIRRGNRPLSMNELAAEAGITKPILYRHFGDRRGLVSAISLELLSSLIGMPEERLRALMSEGEGRLLEKAVASPEMTPDGFRSFLRSFVVAFLEGASREPEVFCFVMQEDGFRSLGAELNATSAPGSQLGYTLARLIRRYLETQGKDPRPAEALGHAVAATVEGTVRWWCTAGQQDRDAMVDLLSGYLWAGLNGAIQD